MPKLKATPLSANPRKKKKAKPAKRRAPKRRIIRRNPPRSAKRAVARLLPYVVCVGGYYWTGDMLDDNKRKAARYFSKTAADRVSRQIQPRLPKQLHGVLARAERVS